MSLLGDAFHEEVAALALGAAGRYGFALGGGHDIFPDFDLNMVELYVSRGTHGVRLSLA